MKQHYFEFDPSKTFLEQTWGGVTELFLDLNKKRELMQYCQNEPYFKGDTIFEMEKKMQKRLEYFANMAKKNKASD